MKKIVYLLLAIMSSGVAYSQCPSPLVPPLDLVNAITNGDFETGSIGPSTAGVSHFPIPSPQSSPGTYQVGSNTSTFNTGMIPTSAHSGSNMLMIDGAPVANAIAWEQTVTVQTNRTYYFSAFLTALSPIEKSQMVFQVVPVAPTPGAPVSISPSFIPPNGPIWKQEFGTWFSGSNTQVTVRLVNSNPTASGGGGNDYAIDDILFRPSCEGVDAGPKPSFGTATLGLCNTGGVIDLNSNSVENPSYTFSWFRDGNAVANPTTPSILEAQSIPGQYLVCLDSAGCIQSATVELAAVLAIDLGADADLCNPAFRELDTRISSPAGFSIQWYRDNTLITGQSGPTFNATGAGTYRVEATDGGSCSGSDEIVITSQVDETVGDVICIAKSDVDATVSVVDNGGTYDWYAASTGGSSIGSGLTFSATGLSGPMTYYVENSNPKISGAGLPNPSSSFLSGSSNTPNNVHGQNFMRFTATLDATFTAVDVFMNFGANASGNVTITLNDLTAPSSSITTSPITHTGGAGNFLFTIPINLPIIATHNYEFSVVGINGQFATLRYDAPGVNNSFTPAPEAVTLTGGQAPQIYPGLFNWQFSSPNTCARVPAAVTEYCVCTPPTSVSISLSPNTTDLAEGDNLTLTAVVDTTNLITLSGSYFFGWYKDDVLISPTTNVYSDLELINVDASAAAVYTLRVEDGNNGFNVCSNTANTTINVLYDIFIPNLITSNGDNINDVFEITTRPGIFDVEIFNRWGSRVYAEKGYTNGWNPTDASAGLYYYNIEDTNTSKVYKGWVQVMH